MILPIVVHEAGEGGIGRRRLLVPGAFPKASRSENY